jgi:hypothetical protein
MAKVDDVAYARAATLRTEARNCLMKAATDSIFYVALGKVLQRDLAEKYGLTESDVEGALCGAAVALVDAIRGLNS